MATNIFTRTFTRVINSLKKTKYWLSFLLGLSLVFAYAPFSFWVVPFVVIPAWLKLLNYHTAKDAAKIGFAFGFGWFASGISWVHVAIDQFGGLPLAASILLMLLLCLYLAIFPAIGCYLAAQLTVNKRINIWLLPATWLISEYIRGVFLTGFPWLSLGYTQINSPLNSFAPVIGEFGLTSIIFLLCISIYNIFTKKHLKFPIVIITCTALSLMILSQISWTSVTGKTTKVALIQGNIEQDIKWDKDQVWPTMLKYLDLSRVNFDADIVVWPESAITSLEPVAQDFLKMANQSAALKNSAIITGILNYNFESKEYFNSLIVLGKETPEDTEGDYFYGNPNRFDKYHLLPIGEFVPFQEWLKEIAPLFNLPNSSFSRGEYIQPNLMANGINLLPLICFEIAFPSQLSANFNNDTNLILTVSNDSWFGNSHGPHQHLDIAKMRALEFGRPLIRATNNGITAIVDQHGLVTKVLPQFEEGVLTSEISLVSGQTPYSRWGHLTQWVIPLLILLSYIIGIYRQLHVKR